VHSKTALGAGFQKPRKPGRQIEKTLGRWSIDKGKIGPSGGSWKKG